MPYAQETVASALLPFVHEQAVVDSLFGKAQLSQYPTTVLQRSVSKSVADRYYKKDLGKVLAIVQDPGSDPETLSKFAKDQRVSVREALLHNPSTPYETLKTLAQWALERKDFTAVSHAIQRFTSGDLVEFLAKNRSRSVLLDMRWVGVSYYASQGISFDRMLEVLRPHPEDLLAVVALRLNGYGSCFALAAHHGQAGRVTITDVFDALDNVAEREAAAMHVARHSGVLTVDVAQNLPMSFNLDSEEITFVEPDALSLVARLSPASFRTALELGLPEADALEIVADSKDAMVHALLDVMGGKREFSATFETRFVRRLIANAKDSTERLVPPSAFGVLQKLKHRLEDALMEEFIRHAPYASLAGWLYASDSANRPLTGQFQRVMDNPGMAFHDARYDRFRNMVEFEEHSRSEIIEQLSRALAYHQVSDDLVADLASVFDEVLLTKLTYSYTAKIVAQTVETAFGDDVELWSTFLVLATDWSGSLKDLIMATASLSGRELVAQDAQCTSEAQPVDSVVQAALVLA